VSLHFIGVDAVMRQGRCDWQQLDHRVLRTPSQGREEEREVEVASGPDVLTRCSASMRIVEMKALLTHAVPLLYLATLCGSLASGIFLFRSRRSRRKGEL
jgi:hypothetical protein